MNISGGTVPSSTSVHIMKVENSPKIARAFDSVIFVVEASAPKVYPKVNLASASTLSGSVVRTLRDVQVVPKMFYLVASSLGHLRLSAAPLFKGDTGGLRRGR